MGLRLRCAAILAALGVGAPAALAQNYVGAARCGACHAFEFERWSTGPHARALQALTESERSDPKCNGCHTMLPTEADPKFAGVQCEQCHGPGRYYQARYVMRDKELARAVGLTMPGAQQCQVCHTEGAPSIEPFDFSAMWERISHGPAAREQWRKARSEANANLAIRR